MSDDTLDAQFRKAAVDVQSANDAGNDAKLRLYALYKQATEGDVKGGRPGFTNPVGRAKYDAWAKQKGLSLDDAKRAYIAEVGRLLGS